MTVKLQDIDYASDLTRLGVPTKIVTSAYYGYSGTFNPTFVMPHHTASARSSGDNFWVLNQKHYQFLVGRSATVGIGGYKMRQGHAGEGNAGKVTLARNGQITSTNWASQPGGDNTGSDGNSYGMAVALDIDGVGEAASEAQWHSFLTVLALMLYRSGKNRGIVLQHQGYTSRKIDVADGKRNDNQFWNELGAKTEWVASVLGGYTPVGVVDTLIAHPKTQGYWLVAPNGEVKPCGAPDYGDLPAQGVKLDFPISGACVHPAGTGYWLCSEDGGVFCFGNAGFFGTVRDALKGGLPAAPITQICCTPDAKGYWMMGVDGGIFSFGNAAYQGNWTETI